MDNSFPLEINFHPDDNAASGNENKEIPEKQKNDKDVMEILEDGLLICGFGKFYLQFLFASFTSSFGIIVLTTTTSFVIPIAECDLNMTIMQKGLFASMSYLGLLSTSFFVGLLMDSFGRRTFLRIGLLGSFICILVQASSQTFWVMVLGKILEGCFTTFCFPTQTVFLSEVVPKNIRDKMLLFNSALTSFASIVTSVIAWAILTQKLDFVIIPGYFTIHSWNIFLYICSIWSLIGFITYSYLPESPKYLLSHGRNGEALDVLRYIYRMNTGKDEDTFPIKTLTTNGSLHSENKKSVKKHLLSSLSQAKNLLRKPLHGQLLLFALMAYVTLIVVSSLRLWYPQITAIFENYQKEHNKTEWFCPIMADYTDSLKQKNLMEVPDFVNNITVEKVQECVTHISGANTYISNVTTGTIALISTLIISYIIGKLGHRPIICFLFIISCVCASAVYWTNSAIQIAMLLSLTAGFMGTCLSLQINLFVRVFPTIVRLFATQIIIVTGRIGALTGSFIFPILLTEGCMLPFIILVAFMLGCTVVVYFLPNPNKLSGDK